MKQKPELSLSNDTLDVNVLINLFRKLTGRDPTQAEIDEAMEELKNDSSNPKPK